MGVIIRILVFLVGALGLAMSGLYGAENLSVDSQALLGNVPGGVAEPVYGMFGQGMEQLAGLLAGVAGEADPDKPNLVATWGPESISGLVSAVLMLFSTRRSRV